MGPTLLLWAALWESAWAARPPPDYREDLVRAAVQHAEQLNAQGQYEDAIAFARSFQRTVTEDGDIAYEIAFAYNRMAKLEDALSAYGDALKLSPDNAAALYDRGEILLALGRDAEALTDLEAAARLRPDHWVVYFRLAELAGKRGDADAFEEHLTDALRHGFDLRTLVKDPTWRAWFRDPRLGPVLLKLVTVYGDETMLEGL